MAIEAVGRCYRVVPVLTLRLARGQSQELFERALVHPEQYGHLIVRVSGYSARFVELDAVTQRHIMERTLF